MIKHLPKLSWKDVLIVVISLFLLFYIAVGFWPRSFWFQYSAIEVESGQSLDKPIVVKSIIDGWYRDVDVQWNDVLRCDLGTDDGFKFISNYESGASITASNTPLVSTWLYQGPLPTTPGTCFLDSSITVTTLFGFKKQQTLQSNIFELVQADEQL